MSAAHRSGWTPIFNAAIRSGADGALVSGFCDVGLLAALSLTVTDATGASTTTTGALDCTGIAP